MDKKIIKLKVVTPERVVYESEIYQVTLPTQAGEVTILPNHRSYIASLKPGEIITKSEKGEEEISLAVAGGFVEFHDNSLVVLADEAHRAEEIDIEEVEKAKKRAEDIKNRVIQTDEMEYARVAASLEIEMAKLKVAQRYMKRRGL
ncbi:MAG: ATP synthase epsilon chain [Candidatus Moranbacteria bacterium GW2011_GWF2_34_56]|nr:MAG: ATP synthase epsilon chain [Candidatus Moranbacteria bacterium GW2011_GWF1_34_10]KKP63019.1 MAG: ATP synthase epsilon chain [Candidatus Moranbacteria bacterium GW2011_GWF2_34_56]